MRDSCKPSKLEPGLAATNSMPRSLMVCTMASEPGLVMVRTETGGRALPASRASCSGVGAGVVPAGAAATSVVWRCAIAAGVVVASAAAPAAALFKKPRRPTEFFLVFGMFTLLSHAWIIKSQKSNHKTQPVSEHEFRRRLEDAGIASGESIVAAN